MKTKLSNQVKQDMHCKFETSGEIKLVPYSWDSENELFDHPTRYRAMVNVQENGHTHIVPSQTGSHGRRYKKIYVTANGEVRTTQSRVIMVLSFPLKYGKTLVGRMMHEEMKEMEVFIRTRKNVTNWAEA